MRAFLVLSTLLAGCGKVQTPTTPPGDDDDDDTTTEDSGHSAAPPVKRAAEVRFWANLAWDATRGEVVSPIIDGVDDYISAYVVGLYAEGWTANDDQSYCLVVIDARGLPMSADAVTDGFVFGVDIPPAGALGADGSYSDCADKGFDPEQWTDGDPLNDFHAADWKLRLGGTLSAELIEWLTPAASTSTGAFDLGVYAAGDWATETGGYETEPDSNYWYGYPMDDLHNIDKDRYLQAAEMGTAPGGLPTGYYHFDQRVFWTLEETTTGQRRLRLAGTDPRE